MAGDFEKVKISELDQIQNDQQGIPQVDIASLMEVAEPQQNGAVYESKSISIEQLKNYIFEKAFPVGSIYISTTNTNPKYMFGGEWEEYAKGRTIFGFDQDRANSDKNNWSVGSQGGSKSVTLNNKNLPQHSHDLTIQNKLDTGAIEFALRNPYQADATAGNPFPVSPSIYVPSGKGCVTVASGGISHTWNAGSEVKNQPDADRKKADVVSVDMPQIKTTATMSNVGQGDPINILPPYIVCRIWRRTS